MSLSASTEYDDPSLICTLVARNWRTSNLWRHPNNTLHYIPPSFTDTIEPSRTSRESSLSESIADSASEAGSDDEPAIRLTFDNMPKVLSHGFVFGSNPKVCDVYCGRYEREYRMDHRTFAISFNNNGDVILQHTTQKTITKVQYNEQEPGTRKAFTWILFPGREILVTVASKLQFSIKLPKHRGCEPAYEAYRAQYLQARRNAVPPLSQLGLDTYAATGEPSAIPTPNARRFYYRVPDSDLGRGAYGRVFLVRDVSNGNFYAAKEFFGNFSWHETKMLSGVSHDHIVKYIEHTSEDIPMLVMEYLEGKSLRNQYRDKHLSYYEVATVLHQGLLALEYLHGRSPPVTHRDIKPDNILFKSRDPLHIKLGDFGLAKEGTAVAGTRGTFLYSAPEIFSHKSYDTAVDIWSLAVVILQIIRQGRVPLPNKGRREGLDWCNDIARSAQKLHSNSLAVASSTMDPSHKVLVNLYSFLTEHMLKTEPKERLSAESCLDVGMNTNFPWWGTGQNSGQSSTGPTDQRISHLHQQSQAEEDIKHKSETSTPRSGNFANGPLIGSRQQQNFIHKDESSPVNNAAIEVNAMEDNINHKQRSSPNSESSQETWLNEKDPKFLNGPFHDENRDQEASLGEEDSKKEEKVGRLTPYRYNPDDHENAKTELARGPPSDESPSKRLKLPENERL